MKILIIGSGLSGASLARILKDNGNDVFVIEKEGRIGGLCVTNVDKNGLKYEPFGARTFHTSNHKIIDFVQRFGCFNGYTHKKGMIINNKLIPFPINRDSIKKFSNKDKIFQELQNRPKEIDKNNFETTCISIFGRTLYELFIKNYTEKMWGMKASEILSDWAPKRLGLRDNEDTLVFSNQWQGLPSDGYSVWIENMLEGINVKLNCSTYNTEDYDLIITTAPIDSFMNYSFGRLNYRSIKFTYKENEKWENNKYGTINLPQHKKFIRKCNFKILHKQESSGNIIQYQTPTEYSGNNIPMYPILSNDNENTFDLYLRYLCNSNNIIPTGRLGLYKYLDMDKAIEMSFDIAMLVDNYARMSPIERYNILTKIRNKY